MDLFPTLTRIAGGKVPEDRVIDGIDVSGFFFGKQEKSGREVFIVYMGNDIFGVNLHNWKVNFKELGSAMSKMVECGTPRVRNLASRAIDREKQ